MDRSFVAPGDFSFLSTASRRSTLCPNEEKRLREQAQTENRMLHMKTKEQEQQLKAFEAQVSSLKADLLEANTKLAGANSARFDAKRSLESSQTQVLTTKLELLHVENQLRSYTSKDQARAERRTSSSSVLHKYRPGLNGVRNMFTEKARKLTATQNSLTKLQNDLECQTTKAKELQESLSMTHEELATVTKAKAQSELLLTDTQMEVLELTRRVEHLQQESQQLTHILSVTKNNLSIVAEGKEHAETAIIEMQQELQQQGTNLARTQQELVNECEARADLQTRSDAAEFKVVQLSTQVQQLTELNTELCEKLAVMAQELSNTQNAKERSDEAGKQLQAHVEQLKHEIDAVHMDLDITLKAKVVFENSLHHAQAELILEREAKMTSDNALAESQSQAAQLSVEVQCLTARADELEVKVAECTRDLFDARHAREIASQQMMQLKGRLGQVEQDANTLNAELEITRKAKAVCDNNLDLAKAELVLERERRMTSDNALAESQFQAAQLTVEVQRLTSKTDELEIKLAQFTRDLSDAGKAREIAKEELMQLNCLAEQMEQEVNSLNEELDTTRKVKAVCDSNLDRAMAELVLEREKQIASDKALAESQSRATRLTEEVQRFTLKTCELESYLAELTQNLSTARRAQEIANEEMKQLQDRVHELTAAKEQADVSLASMQSQEETLNNTVRLLQEQKQELTHELHVAKCDLANTKIATQESLDLVDQLKKQLQHLQVELLSAKDSNAMSEAACDKWRVTAEELEQKLSLTMTELSEQSTLQETTEIALKSSINKVSRLTDAVEEMRMETLKLEDNLAVTNEERSTVKEAFKQLEDATDLRTKKLGSALESSRVEVTSQRAEMERTEKLLTEVQLIRDRLVLQVAGLELALATSQKQLSESVSASQHRQLVEDNKKLIAGSLIASKIRCAFVCTKKAKTLQLGLQSRLNEAEDALYETSKIAQHEAQSRQVLEQEMQDLSDKVRNALVENKELQSQIENLETIIAESRAREQLLLEKEREPLEEYSNKQKIRHVMKLKAEIVNLEKENKLLRNRLEENIAELSCETQASVQGNASLVRSRNSNTVLSGGESDKENIHNRSLTRPRRASVSVFGISAREVGTESKKRAVASSSQHAEANKRKKEL